MPLTLDLVCLSLSISSCLKGSARKHNSRLLSGSESDLDKGVTVPVLLFTLIYVLYLWSLGIEKFPI